MKRVWSGECGVWSVKCGVWSSGKRLPPSAFGTVLKLHTSHFTLHTFLLSPLSALVPHCLVPLLLCPSAPFFYCRGLTVGGRGGLMADEYEPERSHSRVRTGHSQTHQPAGARRLPRADGRVLRLHVSGHLPAYAGLR